jgi:hypothetical protein
MVREWFGLGRDGVVHGVLVSWRSLVAILLA